MEKIGKDDLSKIENGVSQMMLMMIQDYNTLQNAFNSLYLCLQKRGLVTEEEMKSMSKFLIEQEKK